MTTLGYILLVPGLALWIAGEIRFLAIAYRSGLGWLLGCLFVPFADCVFLLLNFRTAAKPFALAIIGMVLTGLGCYLAGIVWPD